MPHSMCNISEISSWCRKHWTGWSELGCGWLLYAPLYLCHSEGICAISVGPLRECHTWWYRFLRNDK